MIKHYAKDYYQLRQKTPKASLEVALKHDDDLQSIIDCYTD